MVYLKVMWQHEQNDYPIVLYSELDENRYEVRKVEEFSNGILKYAHKGGSSGSTTLGEAPVPTLKEIESDPQFKPLVISRNDFETVWEEATVTSKNQ